jgi:hypothetical protein
MGAQLMALLPSQTIGSFEQDISCTLLPGKFTDANPVPTLYNAVYQYWKKTWAEFFQKAGSPASSLNLENFMRQSYIITLHREEKIVATLLSSIFNLSSFTTYDHPCIVPFPSDILNGLKTKGRGLCMTGEYLSVHPDYRKSLVGISMADVITGLLMNIFAERRIDIALAATVRDAKVDEICRQFGYVEVGSYLKMGVDCVMLFNTQNSLREHPNNEVAAMVKKLWKNRNDLTRATEFVQEEQKAA